MTCSAGLFSGVAQLCVSFDFISYGSGCGSTRPGVSTRVELTSVQSSAGRQPRGAMKEVPRKSRIDLIGSPAASRCVNATSARSALPNSRMSALESGNTERFTVSDQ